jgi:ElaB/YqjD/DUF883 family membrane-anchored ribosome-binding protein
MAAPRWPARFTHLCLSQKNQENAMSEAQVSKEKLVSDFKAVVADTEELLKLTAGQAGEKVADVRARLGERLTSAKYKLQDLEAAVVEKTKAAARATDDYVHENPWKAVGVAAGVGFLLGLLVNRR